jgi:hypothetical protein
MVGHNGRPKSHQSHGNLTETEDSGRREGKKKRMNQLLHDTRRNDLLGGSPHKFAEGKVKRAPDAPFPAETEVIEGLLECQQCGFQELARLTLEQYKTLARQPFLKRECARCAATTKWAYSYVDAQNEFLGEPMPASGPPPSTRTIEKRSARRLAIKLRVRIRLDNGREEIAHTENLSRIGVCFISKATMNMGEFIRLVFVTTGLGGRTEILGRIVRRQELPGKNRTMYGVYLEKRS